MLDNVAFSSVHRTCPNLQELLLRTIDLTEPLSPAIVFNHLTALTLMDCATPLQDDDEGPVDFALRLPLLHTCMPQLQRLEVYGVGCAPQIVNGCTGLRRNVLKDLQDYSNFDVPEQWTLAVGAFVIPSVRVSVGP